MKVRHALECMSCYVTHICEICTYILFVFYMNDTYDTILTALFKLILMLVFLLSFTDDYREFTDFFRPDCEVLLEELRVSLYNTSNLFVFTPDTLYC